MQDFATYNRYLKELLTKKNLSYFFSLTYQTEGNAFWSHAVIAGSLDLFKKSITCAYLAPRLQVLILLQHGPCERLSMITSITKTMTANRHMTILKEMSIRRCFSLIITTPCFIAPFKLRSGGNHVWQYKVFSAKLRSVRFCCLFYLSFELKKRGL